MTETTIVPHERFLAAQERRGMAKVNMPKPPEHYYQEPDISPQEHFSEKVKHMVFVPLRGELLKGHFANFLKQANINNLF